MRMTIVLCLLTFACAAQVPTEIVPPSPTPQDATRRQMQRAGRKSVTTITREDNKRVAEKTEAATNGVISQPTSSVRPNAQPVQDAFWRSVVAAEAERPRLEAEQRRYWAASPKAREKMRPMPPIDPNSPHEKLRRKGINPR